MSSVNQFGQRSGEARVYDDQSAAHVHQQSSQNSLPPHPHHHAQAPAQAAPTSAANHQLTQSHLAPGPLDLGFLPAASSSQTSLLEAVVGPTSSAPARGLPAPPQASHPSALDPRSISPKYQDRNNAVRRDSSEGGQTFGTNTEKEWDVLSDASLKLNEGDPEAVEELQKKVNKRRSNLPQLESELAALEAQIKAAEERIAKAQSGSHLAQSGQTV